MRSIMATRRDTFPRRRRARSRRTFLGPRGPLARSSKNLQKQFCAAAETADEVDEEAASYALVRALRAFQRRRTAAFVSHMRSATTGRTAVSEIDIWSGQCCASSVIISARPTLH